MIDPGAVAVKKDLQGNIKENCFKFPAGGKIEEDVGESDNKIGEKLEGKERKAENFVNTG